MKLKMGSKFLIMSFFITFISIAIVMGMGLLKIEKNSENFALKSLANVTPPALLRLDGMRVIAPVVHLVPGRRQNAGAALAIDTRKFWHGPGQDGALAKTIRGRRAMGARRRWCGAAADRRARRAAG